MNRSKLRPTAALALSLVLFGCRSDSNAPHDLAGRPVITRLPSSGGNAGQASFDLAVNGRLFVNGSVITWNGADRPTLYTDDRQLHAAISAADVAAPGTVTVAVRTSGVGVSDGTPFTIRTVPTATASNLFIVPIASQGIEYDSITDRIYATVPPTGGANANSVIAIDPHTGRVTASVFVGNDPGRVTRSGDGQFLYVSLNADADVRRVQISPLTAQLQFAIGPGFHVVDMAVLPGKPHTLVVARAGCCSTAGVAVFDDGVARQTTSSDFSGPNSIAFGADDSTLYGFNNATTAFTFTSFSITPSGIKASRTADGLVGGGYGYIQQKAGRIYSSYGAVADPDRFTRVGVIPSDGGALYVDPALGRAFVINGALYSAYDLNTYALIGHATIAPGGHEHPGSMRMRLIRWGTDGLAYRDGSNIYMFQSPIVSR